MNTSNNDLAITFLALAGVVVWAVIAALAVMWSSQP